MNPQEILDRLDKARAIIAALPPDARILCVEVDGTANIPGCSDTSYIHLANRLEDLVVWREYAGFNTHQPVYGHWRS